MSPEERRLRQEERHRKTREYLAKVRPAVESAMSGDYKRAFQQFKILEKGGSGTFARQEAMCLLRMGRASEGIQLMRAAHRMTDRDRLVALCLAVSAGDRVTMMDCLAGGERNARMQAAFGSMNHAAFEAVRTARIRESEIDVPRRLMEAALDLGNRYDREDLNLLGDEAVRRGETDSELLFQYAGALETNGQIRKALRFYELAAKNATDDQHASAGKFGAYQMKCAIEMNCGDRSVDEWESDLQKRASRYYRPFWN